MAPLQRSLSMPPSLSDILPKLKVFSGKADKDEVSESSVLTFKKSPTLEPVHEGVLSKTGSSPLGDSPLMGSRWPPIGRRIRRSIDLGLGGGRNSVRQTSDGSLPNPSSNGGTKPLPLPLPAGYSGGERISRATSDPSTSSASSSSAAGDPSPTPSPTSTPTAALSPSKHASLTQKSNDWFTKQSNDLIMNALSRGNTSGGSWSSTPVPAAAKVAAAVKPTPAAAAAAPKSDLNKPTAGALAALGLRAATIAGPTSTSTNVIPPTPIEPKKSDIPAPAASAPSKAMLQPSQPVGGALGGKTSPRSRSPSPFFRARKSREERRARDKSPDILPLRNDSVTDAAESDGESVSENMRGRYRPQASAYESPDESGDEHSSEPEVDSEVEHTDEGEDHGVEDDDDFDVETFFDDETNQNTEANAIYAASNCDDEQEKDPAAVDPEERQNFDVYGEEIEQDMLGEGPNVVVPQEPIFQAPSAPGPKRRKSLKTGLELETSRPVYARDRCTITITQGDPDGALDLSGKRMRRYVVLSDLSEESRYAVEWAIGTVARDGDEVFLISVMEDESKVDPKKWSAKDQSMKLKVQKERQTTAVLLVRQVTSLLSRTRLNITVTCQALHAKNARHMLLDLIDFLEPTTVIVGSRGLGQLKGILLGSTSHYLVQKSSVPVMVARRRLHRPLRRTNPEDLRHSPRVSLASANIEKVASTKQEDDVVDAADEEALEDKEKEERERARALAK